MSERLRGIVTTAVSVSLAVALLLAASGSAGNPSHQAFKDQTRERLRSLEARMDAVEAQLAPATPTPAPIAITDINVVETGADYAIIEWTVNPPAQGWVEYGLTDAYGNETTHELRLLGYHRQRIGGLQPETTYHFRVIAYIPALDLTASAVVAA